MPITFKKPSEKVAEPSNLSKPATVKDDTPFETESPEKKPNNPNKPPSWLMSGTKAKKAQEDHKKSIEEAKKMAQEKAKEYSKPKRFWVAKNEKTNVTVIDGQGSGYELDPVMAYEHQYKSNGKWGNFALCTLESEGECPLCLAAESGENVSRRALTAFFSLIDHTEWTSNNGKVYKDQLKVLAMKPQSFETLQQIMHMQEAQIEGTTFAVARSGDDKSVSVGNTWVPKSYNKLEDVCSYYEVAPIDWEHFFTYRTADELREMGFGGGPSVNQAFGSTTSNLDDEL